jgi:hypothetical protein
MAVKQPLEFGRQPFTGRLGTGPFFGQWTSMFVSACPENINLSPFPAQV